MGLRDLSNSGTGISAIFNTLVARSGSKRVPFELTCSQWTENNIGAINMSVNPNSVGFSQNKRTTSRNTIGGKVFFHWADVKGRNLDLLQLSLKGETGPISSLGVNSAIKSETSVFKLMDSVSGESQPDPKMVNNASNWAKFYNLTLEPMINPQTYQPNLFSIRYKSLLIPYITFYGFYNTALQFEDSAADPFSKKWSVTFTVTATDPDITEIKTFLGDIDANTTLILAPTVGTQV